MPVSKLFKYFDFKSGKAKGFHPRIERQKLQEKDGTSGRAAED